MTEEPLPNGSLSAGDVTALITLINGMLVAMEQRIIARLDANAAAATERWAKHDAELLANTKRIVDRFERIERDIAEMASNVADHHHKAEIEQVTRDARIRPIRGSLAWMWSHWRDIVLLLIGMVAAATFLVDALGRIAR